MLKAEETDQMIPLDITTPQGKSYVLRVILWKYGCHASSRLVALAPFPFEEPAIFDRPFQWLRQIRNAAGRRICAHMLHFLW